MIKLGDPSGTKEVSLSFGKSSAPNESDNIIFDGEDLTREGSILYVGEKATVSIFPGTVIQNAVTSISGGAVYVEGKLLMHGGRMTACRSLGAGGAISGTGEFYLAAGTITSCSAEYGGAIYNEGKLTLIGTEIKSCNANKGGAVFNAKTMELFSSSISECSAGSGGGVYNSGTATFKGGQFVSCGSSETLGGGLYNSGTATLDNTYWSSNHAAQGGTIYNTAMLTIQAGQLYNGKAETYGGHIYNDPFAEIIMTGGTLGSGKALYGGGLYNLGTFRHEGGGFSGNNATLGKAILNDGMITVCKGASFLKNNDLFVVVSDDNRHILHLESSSNAEVLLYLTPGIATKDGYEVNYTEGIVLVDGDGLSEAHERIFITSDEKNEWFLDADGTLMKRIPFYSKPIFYLLLLLAFTVVVILTVVLVRLYDKKIAKR